MCRLELRELLDCFKHVLSDSLTSVVFHFLPNACQIIFNGRIYQTLDNTPFAALINGSQTQAREIPNGFRIAYYRRDVVEEVVEKYPWGCCALVLQRVHVC